jgi:hypothetical protein
MQGIRKLKTSNKKRLLALLFPLALVFLSANVAFSTAPAYADPPNTVLATVKYCKSKMPNKLDSLCTEKNMNRLRAAFNDQCNGKAACIENAAEGAINQIARKSPKNAQEFNDALDAAVSNAAGGGGGAAGGGGGGKGPDCTGSSCDATPTGQGQNCTDNHCDLVALYVNPTIRILSIIVGLVVAASLVMGGVQYASSSGDPQKTSAAKSRITNTLLAFLASAFMYAFLNFLIPGGLFH